MQYHFRLPQRLAMLFSILASTLLSACGSNTTGSNATDIAPYDFSAAQHECQTTGGATHANMPGFYVEEGVLYDGFGNPFIIRGVNYPYSWFRQLDTEQQFADIAATCANSVRVVLSTGDQWDRVDGDEVAQIIRWAKQNSLVAVLEVHDATGWPEKESAAHPQVAVDYWLSDDIRAAIDGLEGYVIINIANEPMGNTSTDQWEPFHTSAVRQLRQGGINHTLIIDAPNWGQDSSNTMRDGDAAKRIAAADPTGNLVFSVHMYQVYDRPSVVKQYFTTFLETGFPLIVGEFAEGHGTHGDVAEATIFEQSRALKVGYLAWSWSGNTKEDGIDSLDMVENFDSNQLTPWGQIALHSQHGIRATSRLCTCFKEQQSHLSRDL